MSDSVFGSADFADLGEMEIENAGDIFAQCEFVRARASAAGLIILQWALDVESALISVPVVDPGGWHGIGADTSERRARRVALHVRRSAEAMNAVGEAAAKFPGAYRFAFRDVIQRRRGRRTFNPSEGL